MKGYYWLSKLSQFSIRKYINSLKDPCLRELLQGKLNGDIERDRWKHPQHRGKTILVSMSYNKVNKPVGLYYSRGTQ